LLLLLFLLRGGNSALESHQPYLHPIAVKEVTLSRWVFFVEKEPATR
jgi:hypothetical protein